MQELANIVLFFLLNSHWIGDDSNVLVTKLHFARFKKSSRGKIIIREELGRGKRRQKVLSRMIQTWPSDLE
jgi:hypothetical protein